MMDMKALEKLLRESGKARELMNAVTPEEGRRLESLVDSRAVSEAMANGDAAQLEAALRRILNSGEGRALAERISGIMNK